MLTPAIRAKVLYPCLCLCRGFWQITSTRPCRRMILHFSHIGLTDGRTFMIPFEEFCPVRRLGLPFRLPLPRHGARAHGKAARARRTTIAKTPFQPLPVEPGALPLTWRSIWARLQRRAHDTTPKPLEARHADVRPAAEQPRRLRRRPRGASALGGAHPRARGDRRDARR